MISEQGHRRIEYLVKRTLFDDINEVPYIPRAATEEDIEYAGACLKRLGQKYFRLPEIPADYAEFLMINDGIASNGLYLCGARELMLGEYANPDLTQINERFIKLKGDRLEGKLILGKFDESIYVYSDEDDLYYSLDSFSLGEEEEYASFEEFFLECIAPELFDFYDFEDLQAKYEELFGEE